MWDYSGDSDGTRAYWKRQRDQTHLAVLPVANHTLADKRRAIVDKAKSFKLPFKPQRVGCGRHEAIHSKRVKLDFLRNAERFFHSVAKRFCSRRLEHVHLEGPQNRVRYLVMCESDERNVFRV
jgi:hypothetical protein